MIWWFLLAGLLNGLTGWLGCRYELWHKVPRGREIAAATRQHGTARMAARPGRRWGTRQFQFADNLLGLDHGRNGVECAGAGLHLFQARARLRRRRRPTFIWTMGTP